MAPPADEEQEMKTPGALKLSDPEEQASESDNFPPPFAGMGKEMVLHYSDTPTWNRARKFLQILFWLCWFGLLGAVVFLTVTHPKCKVAPVTDWWQKASVYQIYPRSFKDSNGDGVGDLQGVKEKLDYLESIKVDAVWMSPFYESPMKDFGYDVSDYRAIDPLFGTMGDFDELLTAMHDKGIKMIIDFIPNHSSDQHEWFQKSVDGVKPYDEYYVWVDCAHSNNVTTPPNNWVSIFGGSAWTYNEKRGMCYLHQFLPEQPDLNIRNNLVRDELNSVLRFWLDKGVDGVRVDAIASLYEDYALRDEPLSGLTNDSEKHDYLYHNATMNSPEILDSLSMWRRILDSYTAGDTRVMITEAYDKPENLVMYYGRTRDGGAHLPFNFQLIDIASDSGARWIATQVRDWMDNLPEGGTANWVLGNHDRPRIATRVGQDKVKAVTMLLLLLPGTSTSYYGDEIGMLNVEVTGESQDPVGKDDKSLSRDPERSPMQWTADNSSCHGFTSDCSSSWLPLHPDAGTVNVETEEGDPSSYLSFYKHLVELRTNGSFVYGDWREHVVTDSVYSFLRFFNGADTYLVAINMGTSTEVLDLSDADLGEPDAKVKATTRDLSLLDTSVNLKQVSLEAGEGVVLSWPYVN